MTTYTVTFAANPASVWPILMIVLFVTWLLTSLLVPAALLEASARTVRERAVDLADQVASESGTPLQCNLIHGERRVPRHSAASPVCKARSINGMRGEMMK